MSTLLSFLWDLFSIKYGFLCLYDKNLGLFMSLMNYL